ncbi:MAG: aspartyl/asparaginyl beta-hydroxylase domain-containing protein [Thiolinea sp.]
MKYFRKVEAARNIQPFLDEIASVPNAWDLNTGRQQKIAVQREAETIPLRGLRKSCINGRKRRDVHESRYTTGSKRFLYARAFLEAFATQHNSEPGRAKVVRLKPGHQVYPHIDRGEYYRLHNRYHLILQSPAGSYMRCGDETIRMQEGELWWFDNQQVHEAHNEGDDHRIHLIFDMLPLTLHAEAYPQPSQLAIG